MVVILSDLVGHNMHVKVDLRTVLLSLDARERALVLSQLDVPGFLTLHGRPQPLWEMDGGLDVCVGGGEQEKGGLWLVCNFNKIFEIKKRDTILFHIWLI